MAKISPLTFVKQVRQEVKKISWPTRGETVTTSIMVVIICIIVALFLMAVDGVLASLIQLILG